MEPVPTIWCFESGKVEPGNIDEVERPERYVFGEIVCNGGDPLCGLYSKQLVINCLNNLTHEILTSSIMPRSHTADEWSGDDVSTDR